jgi:hypothetical protein
MSAKDANDIETLAAWMEKYVRPWNGKPSEVIRQGLDRAFDLSRPGRLELRTRDLCYFLAGGLTMLLGLLAAKFLV